MKGLASLGLEVCEGSPVHADERRLEIRIKDTHDFVAWFYAGTRVSNGVRIFSTSTEIVEQKGLTSEHLAAIRKWLRARVREAV